MVMIDIKASDTIGLMVYLWTSGGLCFYLDVYVVHGICCGGPRCDGCVAGVRAVCMAASSASWS